MYDDTTEHGRASSFARVPRPGAITSAVAAAFLASTTVVSAQTASDEETPAEVTVTGSRIVQRDYTANSPIATVSGDVIASTGATTLESALSQFPQFSVGSGPTTTGFFATGQASLNLRGLGPSRNLVLLDGRRLQPSDSQQVVDINTIPKAIIESVEVITGGASAVYGSDAMAGVVNFRMKKHFEGVQVDAEYSTPQHYSSGASQEYSITAGGDFAESRGNAVVSLSYTTRDPIGYLDVPFYRNYAGAGDFRTGQGVYNPGTNRPSQAALDQVFGAYGVSGPPPSTFISFNPDGTLFGASNGLANFQGGLGLRPNADGTSVAYTNISSIVQTPLDRYTLFARGLYDVSDSVTAFVQGHFVNYKSTTVAEAGNTALTIPVTNPFIPDDLATLLASRTDPDAPFTLEKRFYEAGPRVFNRRFNLYQITAGVSGPIAPLDGTWELYATRGTVDINQRNPGSVVAASLAELLNAADGGESLCSGGYNPFGLTTLSDSCRSYLVRTPMQTTRLTQDVVEATAQGRLADLPAGQLRFAVGADFKTDRFDYAPDSDISQGTIVGVNRAGASSGSTRVYEGYVEFLVPLLADLPAIQSLDLDAAYRHSQYNLAGGVDTYKADLNWTVLPSFRVRGGYQRAVRAPNVGELFTAPTAGFAGIGEITAGGGDPCAANSWARSGPNSAQIQALCVAQGVPADVIGNFVNAQNEIPSTNVGNTALTPESADTYTIGAVLTAPSDHALLRGLSLSLDYYDISIKDVVGVITGGQALNKCYNLDGSNPGYDVNNVYCSLLTRDTTTGSLTQVLQQTQNLGAYKTRGIDLQTEWRVGLDAFGLSESSGDIRFSSLVNHLLAFDVQNQPGAPFADYSNTVGSPTNGGFGSLPNWKAVTSLEYSRAALGAGVRWRYISHLRALAKVSNPSSTTPDTKSHSVFDLFANWQPSGQIQVNAGINNLFDKDPPIVNGTLGVTEPSTYDILGRTFYAAVRISL